jgi:hypothetical protein
MDVPEDTDAIAGKTNVITSCQKDFIDQGIEVKVEGEPCGGIRFSGDRDRSPAFSKVHGATAQTLYPSDLQAYRKTSPEIHVKMAADYGQPQATRNQRDSDGVDYRVNGDTNLYSNIQDIAAMLTSYRAPNGKSFGEVNGLIIETHAGEGNFPIGILDYLQDTLSSERYDDMARMSYIGYEYSKATYRDLVVNFTEKCSERGHEVEMEDCRFTEDDLVIQPQAVNAELLENLHEKFENLRRKGDIAKTVLAKSRENLVELQEKFTEALQQQLQKKEKEEKEKLIEES